MGLDAAMCAIRVGGFEVFRCKSVMIEILSALPQSFVEHAKLRYGTNRNDSIVNSQPKIYRQDFLYH